MALPPKTQNRILAALKHGGKMTIEQLVIDTGIHRTSVHAPANELKDRGLITVTQVRAESGNMMNVYQIVGSDDDGFTNSTVTDYAKTKAPQQNWLSGLGMV